MQKDEKSDFRIADGQAGHDVIFQRHLERPRVFRHLHHHHAVIEHVLDFLLRPESKLRHLRQDLPVVDGGVAVGEHGADTWLSVEPAEEGFALLPFLLQPVVQVLGLKFSRAPLQVGEWHPQPVGEKPLRLWQDLHTDASDPHLVEAAELDLVQGHGFIEVAGRHGFHLLDQVSQSCRRFHFTISFSC